MKPCITGSTCPPVYSSACAGLFRAFCENGRLKLLDHDESFLSDPIKRLPIPVAKVNNIRAQIQQLTAARQSSVVETYDTLQDKVALQLHHPEACALGGSCPPVPH